MGEWRSKTTEAETEHSSQDQTALSDSRLLPAMQTDRCSSRSCAPRLPPRARRGVPATPAMIWGVWWRQEEDWFAWSLSTQLPGVPGHEQAPNRSRARLWPLAPALRAVASTDAVLKGVKSARSFQRRPATCHPRIFFKKNIFGATARHTRKYSEEPDEIPGFYRKQKFIPIQNEIIQIHTYGKDPSCLLNETNFQQKGPKQTGPSPLK